MVSLLVGSPFPSGGKVGKPSVAKQVRKCLFNGTST